MIVVAGNEDGEPAVFGCCSGKQRQYRLSFSSRTETASAQQSKQDQQLLQF